MKIYRTIIIVALLAASGCSIQRAQEAAQAGRSMPGLSKAQVLACMGVPAGQMASGSTEVWSYPSGGSTENHAVAQTYGSGSGTYSGMTTGNLTTGTYNESGSATTLSVGRSYGRYCIVNVIFSGDTVASVNYSGRTGGLLTQGEECAYAVHSCLSQ
jgi:hypothetical protein